MMAARNADLDKAIEQLEQALELYPTHAEANEKMAIALTLQGEWSKARSHYQRVVELVPDRPLAMVGLAGNLATHPDPDERDATRAIELAERANALTGHSAPVALDTLAAAYAAAGRYDDAVRVERHLIQLDIEWNPRAVNRARQRLAEFERAAAAAAATREPESNQP